MPPRRVGILSLIWWFLDRGNLIVATLVSPTKKKVAFITH